MLVSPSDQNKIGMMITLIRNLSSYWRTRTTGLLDGFAVRANLSSMATSTKRAAIYVRVSTSDRGQTVENQLQPLYEAAGRLGWTVVAVYRDEGVSGARGRDKRPGLDALV
jgi:hypothetical protein